MHDIAFKRVVPLVICLHLFQAALCDAVDNTRFSQPEIQANVVRFLTRIFGESKPRLVDYYHFDSVHLMAESSLEDTECAKRWEYGKMDKHCETWLKERADNPNVAESLYYRELRKALELDPGTVTIKKIEPHLGQGAFVHVGVMTKTGHAVKLVLRHATDKDFADINGLVRIETVNGVLIHEDSGPLRLDRLRESTTR